MLGINVKEVSRNYFITYRGRVIDPKSQMKDFERKDYIHLNPKLKGGGKFDLNITESESDSESHTESFHTCNSIEYYHCECDKEENNLRLEF
jgi:hypothetical protein